MAVWPVQDAKARFSELLDTVVREGPQTVTKRGVEAAVVVPIDEWRRLQSQRQGFKEWLLSPVGRSDQLEKLIPKKIRLRPRPLDLE